MTRWALPIVFAVLISTVWRITVVPGQTLPESAKASPAPVKAAPMAEIAFYLARGEADACGRGCNQWIAAEGKIDATAAQRLRRLLAKLQNRRPPIFFHSSGGSITGSLELGRLIRAQKLEVSVAHTIPRGCDRDKPLDKACEALKRSGQELEADFDPAISMCNSSCVWVLAGGIARFVPPRVKLGIHDVGLDPDKALPRGTSVADVKRVAHARILEYAREMGIDKALPAAAFAVPNESPRFLGRDEVVRYGIDRREFGETVWHFDDKSAAAMFKSFFVRTDGGDQPRYSNGFVRLSCGAGRDIRLAFSQEDLVKSADPPTIRIDVNGQRIMLTSRQADTHSTLLSADMFDFVGRGSDIKVSGIEQGRNEGSARSVTLNMDGFSGASVKLRQNCDDWQICRNNASDNDARIAACTAALNRGVRDGKQRANAFNDRGLAFANKGQNDRAIQDFDDALSSDPQNAMLFSNRAWAFIKKGEADRALRDLDEAIRLNPNLAIAYANRARAYAMKSDHDHAIADFSEAIRLDPRNAVAYRNRGDAYRRSRDYDRAIADYTEAIRLDPRNPVAYSDRGVAYRSGGDFDRAITDYTEAIRLNPKYAVAHNNRGFAYNGKSDFDHAIADLSEAIRLNPNYAIAYRNRGLAYSNTGDNDHAISDLDEAIRINPRYVGAYHVRGSVYSARSDYARALADLNEAIRLDSKSAISYAVRCEIYSRMGEHDKGIADCNEAIRLDPKSPTAYNNRGFAYNNRGDFAQAIIDLDEAIRINPNDAAAYKNRAVSFEGRNEPEKALADYNAALKLRPRLLEAAEGAKRVSGSLAGNLQ